MRFGEFGGDSGLDESRIYPEYVGQFRELTMPLALWVCICQALVINSKEEWHLLWNAFMRAVARKNVSAPQLLNVPATRPC